MPTTTNKGFDVPARGTEAGVWDVPVNGNAEKLDGILGSVTSKAITGGTTVLTADEMRVMAYHFSGTLASSHTVTSTMPGFYILYNNCVVSTFYVLLTTGLGGNDIAIPPGEPVQAYCDGTNWRFVNIGRTGIMDFWYTSAMPAWVNACTVPPYLCCDGSTFSSATYPQLFRFLSSTTLPDMRSYTMIPLDTMGTAAGAAGRIGTVNTGSGIITGSVIATAGGSNTQGLVANNLPTHTHPVAVTDPGHDHLMRASSTNVSSGTNKSVIDALGSGSAGADTESATTGITASATANSTTNTPHNNMQISKMAGILVIKT